MSYSKKMWSGKVRTVTYKNDRFLLTPSWNLAAEGHRWLSR